MVLRRDVKSKTYFGEFNNDIDSPSRLWILDVYRGTIETSSPAHFPHLMQHSKIFIRVPPIGSPRFPVYRAYAPKVLKKHELKKRCTKRLP